MKTINLRWIYPHYRHDEFVEVSDEVWEVMRQAQREMNNYERRKVYHRAWYSLDAYSWTENYALEHGRSPEEILLEREERAARLRLDTAVPEALAHATPTQARRSRAYHIAGSNQPENAREEGVKSRKRHKQKCKASKQRQARRKSQFLQRERPQILRSPPRRRKKFLQKTS